MENEVKDETPVIPGETLATEVKEAVETTRPAFPKNLMINNFPREIYDQLAPAFDAWNAKHMPKLTFGHFVVHLLADESGTAQTIADLKGKVAEQSSVIARLESLLNQGEERQQQSGEMSQKLSTLEEEYDVLLELKASVELENKELHSKIQELSSRPAPVPSAPALPGQFSEKALLIAMDQVFKNVSQLTAPGLFNKFKTLTYEEIRTQFNWYYRNALQA